MIFLRELTASAFRELNLMVWIWIIFLKAWGYLVSLCNVASFLSLEKALSYTYI